MLIHARHERIAHATGSKVYAYARADIGEQGFDGVDPFGCGSHQLLGGIFYYMACSRSQAHGLLPVMRSSSSSTSRPRAFWRVRARWSPIKPLSTTSR